MGKARRLIDISISYKIQGVHNSRPLTPIYVVTAQVGHKTDYKIVLFLTHYFPPNSEIARGRSPYRAPLLSRLEWFEQSHVARKVFGTIYRLDRQCDCRRMDEGHIVSGGRALSSDVSRLYCSASKLGMVYQCDMDSQGQIAGKRMFLLVDVSGDVWPRAGHKRRHAFIGFAASPSAANVRPDALCLDSVDRLCVCYMGASG